jgi:orotate phosphoribosyltransferase
VDDIFRSGRRLGELKSLVEANGGEVVGLAVMVYQPTPKTPDFGNLPLFYLAKLDAHYSNDAASCELCRKGLPLESVWI